MSATFFAAPVNASKPNDGKPQKPTSQDQIKSSANNGATFFPH
jgi:hypothetical protein